VNASIRLRIKDEADMMDLGARLVAAMGDNHQGIIYLHGDLGAGKTTLVRGLLRSLGVQGAVKSPTYTLVEPYELPEWDVYHFDLYRLSNPEELEFIGIRDYFSEGKLCLIEWPELGEGVLPEADVEVTIGYQPDGRDVIISAHSARGQQIISAINLK
jgi:tRNA threonylcarbamoyladenosine biosynthesis protein TsaE